MTEAEWLASDEPGPMLEQVKASRRRKFRLFACGCCRRVWHLLEPEARVAVEATERFAEGRASKEEVNAARTAAFAVAARDVTTWYGPDVIDADTTANWHPAVAVAYPRATIPRRFTWVAHYAAEFAARAAYLRPEEATPPEPSDCVNALQARAGQSGAVRVWEARSRPVTISRSWRTSTVLTLARQMYESREFSAMPILADALQDAGLRQL